MATLLISLLADDPEQMEVGRSFEEVALTWLRVGKASHDRFGVHAALIPGRR